MIIGSQQEITIQLLTHQEEMIIHIQTNKLTIFNANTLKIFNAIINIYGMIRTLLAIGILVCLRV